MNEYTTKDARLAEYRTRLAEMQQRLDTQRMSLDSVLKQRDALQKYKDDFDEAAGELLVDIPEPGSEMAKLLHANIMMRKYDIPKLEEEIKDLKVVREELRQVISEYQAARYAYASEFPFIGEEQIPDVGSIHRNIRNLKSEHTELLEENEHLKDELRRVKARIDDIIYTARNLRESLLREK